MPESETAQPGGSDPALFTTETKGNEMKKRIEYEFTADDVAEYVRSICRGVVVFNIENVRDIYESAIDCLEDTGLGIVAFCESREAERAEMESARSETSQEIGNFHLQRHCTMPEKPALSRFLPDGWSWDWCSTYKEHRLKKPDGSYTPLRFCTPEYMHSHGLLSPDEGGGWIPHTPGDPMPCDGDLRVDVLYKDSEQCINSGNAAHRWDWSVFGTCDADGLNVIGWRPALAEVAL
jgi:hypothetical protein